MNNLPVMSEDMLINILQTQKEEKLKIQGLDERTIDHDRRITELETNTPINASLNNYLGRLRNQCIVGYLGGKRARAYKYEYPEGSKEHYKTLSRKVYAEAQREFYHKFNIANYGELRQHQYEQAIQFWADYKPSNELLNEINVINNQTELFAYQEVV